MPTAPRRERRSILDRTRTAAPGRVGFVAKDPWNPAIRREHLLAAELVRRGSRIGFVQAPADIGRVRTDPANWLRHLMRAHYLPAAPGVAVTERSTVLQGSRSRGAERLDSALLHGFLRRSGWEQDLTVLHVPWVWRGTRGLRGRVVFDCTDDWGRLLPSARGLPDSYRRIAAEADAVVVVNPALADLFPGRRPVVVPNGTDEVLLRAPRTVGRSARSAVYVGSIAERFDVDLVRAVLRALPDWTLTVHGPLVFPPGSRRAAGRFLALRKETGGRFDYRGPLSRGDLPAVLDAATVALVPDVADRARGQSSMKVFDYCSRGVPVVATRGHLEDSGDLPPHTYLTSGPRDMAEAMVAAAGEPAGWARERIAWAAGRTWVRRTDDWLAAALGAPG